MIPVAVMKNCDDKVHQFVASGELATSFFYMLD